MISIGVIIGSSVLLWILRVLGRIAISVGYVTRQPYRNKFQFGRTAFAWKIWQSTVAPTSRKDGQVSLTNNPGTQSEEGRLGVTMADVCDAANGGSGSRFDSGSANGRNRRIAAESVMHLLPNRRLLLNLFSLPWPTRLHADHREKRRRYGLAGRDLALMISKIGHRQRTPRRSSCAISIISARV